MEEQTAIPLEPLNNVAEKTEASECITHGIHKKEHGGAKPPPKGLIRAKFTYFLHFFSFLHQTCQIDYDCWPNNIRELKNHDEVHDDDVCWLGKDWNENVSFGWKKET